MLGIRSIKAISNKELHLEYTVPVTSKAVPSRRKSLDGESVVLSLTFNPESKRLEGARVSYWNSPCTALTSLKAKHRIELPTHSAHTAHRSSCSYRRSCGNRKDEQRCSGTGGGCLDQDQKSDDNRVVSHEQFGNAAVRCGFSWSLYVAHTCSRDIVVRVAE